jgi:hypothetical protein
VRDGHLHETLQEAYSKIVNNNYFDVINEVEEEYASSTLYTNSQKGKFVVERASSALRKGLDNSNSKRDKSNEARRKHPKSIESKSATKISVFDEGLIATQATSNPLSFVKVSKSHNRTASEMTPPRVGDPHMGQLNISSEKFKYSFRKVQPEMASTIHLATPKCLVTTNENKKTHLNNEISCKDTSEVKAKSKPKDKTPKHPSSEKISWNFPKSTAMWRRKMFQSDKVCIEKITKPKDRDQRCANRALTFTQPCSTSLPKETNNISRCAERLLHIRCENATETGPLVLKEPSREKRQRNISANSRSSKESFDLPHYTSRLAGSREYRSYFDTPQNSHPSHHSHIFRQPHI